MKIKKQTASLAAGMLVFALLVSGCAQGREPISSSLPEESFPPAESKIVESQAEVSREDSSQGESSGSPGFWEYFPEEEISYPNGDSGAFLTDAHYYIDSDIFSKAWEEFDAIYYTEWQREDSKVVPREVEGNKTDPLVLLEFPDSVKSPSLPYVCGDKMYFFGSLPEEDDTYTHLFCYDMGKKEIINSYTPRAEGMHFFHMAVTSDTIYWSESDLDHESGHPKWKVFSRDIKTGEVQEVDSWENYGPSALEPVLSSYGDRVAYIVGEDLEEPLPEGIKSMGNARYYVYLLEGGEKKRIFTVRNVGNPYEAPNLDEKALYFTEYFEDGWYLLTYYFQDGRITRQKLPFLTDGEFPDSAVRGSQHLFFHSSNLNVLYAYNFKTGQLQVLQDCGGGVSRTALVGDRYLYTAMGKVYQYDPVKNTRSVWSETYVTFIAGGAEKTVFRLSEYDEDLKREIDYYALY